IEPEIEPDPGEEILPVNQIGQENQDPIPEFVNESQGDEVLIIGLIVAGIAVIGVTVGILAMRKR
ncbi:MAG: hypothetical protein V3T99_06845, partial [Nitrososphaerales archaeon]